MASSSKHPEPCLGEELHDGPHDWEQHKEIIRNLYIVENFTLQSLMEEMGKSHAFCATYASFLLGVCVNPMIIADLH
jgi:hypothetical protein